MQEAARQLIRALRGTRSQVAFSRRLGFKGNPVAHWESGRRTPTAREFFIACERVGVSMEGGLARFHPSPPPSSPDELPAWMNTLRGSMTMVELSTRTGHSRYTISRWLSGASSPRLNQFLALVDLLTGRVCDMVAELVPIGDVPALAEAHRAQSVARSLAHDEPWTEALLRVVESRSCRLGDISAQLPIDRETEERCIEKLITAGILRVNDGVFEVVGELSVDTRAVPSLKTHWARVAGSRLAKPLEEDLFSYNVFSVSEEDLAEIRALMLATYRQIRAVVSNSSGTERVALINLQMVNWPEGELSALEQANVASSSGFPQR